MADPRFFRCAGPKALGQLADMVQAEVILPESLTRETLVQDIAPMDLAQTGMLALFHSASYRDNLADAAATFCLTEEKLVQYVPKHMGILVCAAPQRAYALIAQAFYPDEANTVDIGYPGVHPSAQIGHDVQIGAYACIGPDVTIGDGTVIGAHATIGSGCVIGARCQIHTHVNISHTLLGDDVCLYPGASIGAPGFGFHMDKNGALSIPQIGRVIIQDGVVVGPTTCINRGSGHDTVIGAGARIDGQVQIAHNVHIGQGSVIVAQVGIAGSTKIGRFCVIGGQAGIAGHLRIGDRVQIAGCTGVMRDIETDTAVGGIPAVGLRDWKRQVLALQRLSAPQKHENIRP